MKGGIQILFILAQNFTSFMVKAMANKKHLVASFHNLSPELQEEIKQKYPLGFTDAMIRVDKPNGDFFYAVPYDTDEISYLVKIDVKIDDLSGRRGGEGVLRRRDQGRRRHPGGELPGGGGDGRRRGNLTAGAAGALPDFPRGRSGFFIAAADGVPNGCAPLRAAARFRRRNRREPEWRRTGFFGPCFAGRGGLRVPVGKAPATPDS